MSSLRRLKRIKWAVYGVTAILTVFVILLGLASPESIKAISAFNINQSPVFVLLRMGSYIALYIKWKSIVLSFNPNAPKQRIVKSRQSMMTVIVIYEVLVGFNILKVLEG